MIILLFVEITRYLKNKNFEIWKKIYEDFYKIPLKYTTNIKESDSINEE